MPLDPATSRCFTRRSFFRYAAGASALASMPILTEAHLALAQRPHFADPNKGIHIDANENPLGPSDAARQAMIDIVPRGGRYLMNFQAELEEIFAKQEGLSPESVRAFAGSSDPLHFTVLANTSKDRPLVVADPGYEAPMWAAKAGGASVIKVPLADPKGAAKHDIKAMLAAASNPGVIYICNPNNPTGTCTPREEIEYAVAHAPKDALLLIDEAYIHLCDQPRSLDFVKEGKNVVVLRTFSKLYGMAGVRMGFAIGRPDLLAKLNYFGDNSLPITALAAAKASLLDTDLVATRKKIIGDVRAENLAWCKSQGYAATPSESNCFMLDTRRPGKEVMAAMAAKDIYIGRIWPAWPTQVRITVGTKQEMEAFQKAFAEVMSGSTAGLTLPKRKMSLRERPFENA
ncbi:aminotransferase class I/II-fold pyridoxal phosphate-dependent enzyme [Acidobacteria bacterium AB60]|nr:aminotransferase class I/II-fold pyridoxal phosphate-dependent enzyme [Acidobacteria bacterium AB60]